MCKILMAKNELKIMIIIVIFVLTPQVILYFVLMTSIFLAIDSEPARLSRASNVVMWHWISTKILRFSNEYVSKFMAVVLFALALYSLLELRFLSNISTSIL